MKATPEYYEKKANYFQKKADKYYEKAKQLRQPPIGFVYKNKNK